MANSSNVAQFPSPYPELDGFLARVGNTPLVPIRNLPRGVVAEGVEIWAKLEWFNPSGSVKARAALSMVIDAERSGRLRPGMHILDSSSGNTGIAYALIAASRGYKLTLCLPTNANAERKTILRAFGVDIVETSPLEGSDGAIRVARELAAADPDKYVYLDQYSNEANWRAHFATTGPEIWRDTGGRVTHWVSTLGTSGTFVGTSRFLLTPGPRHLLLLRAAGLSVPTAWRGSSTWRRRSRRPSTTRPIATADLGAPTEDSLAMVRRLAREEGLLVGPSSGAAMWAALEVAKTLASGVVVTLFPDSGERYLSEHHIFGAE